MKNLIIKIIVIMICFSFIACARESGTNIELFKTVEKLKIKRNGYVLGAVLNKKQQKTAKANPLQAATFGTYKFNDKGLNIVADKTNDRVLVIYEQFENVVQKDARNLVGELFMEFDEPTVSAHDSVVYWAWGKNKKFSAKEFEDAKENKKKLDIFATVKLNSDIKIMGKSSTSSSRGTIYYVISSDPLLKLYNPGKNN